MALPGVASAEITWNAAAGVRELINKVDDGLATTDALGKDTSKSTTRYLQYRAMLGASAKSDNLDWGVDVRTQPAGVGFSGAAVVTSEWVTNAQSADFGAGIGQAYGRYHQNLWDTDFALTFGRAKTVLLYDNVVQNLIDNDTRWDGFGWTIKHGMFGLNATQYILGAVSQGVVGASTYARTEASDSNPQTQSHFGVLYSVQPYVRFKLTKEITSTFALGWLNWAGTGGNTNPGTGFYTNDVHGGTAAPTAAGGAGGNVNPVILDNSQQWQLFSDTSLAYDLRFMMELVHNKKILYGTRQQSNDPAVTAGRDAWAATLAWDSPKKAGDIYFAYSYGSKAIGSVIFTFTNGDVAPDNNSHFLEGRYYYADNVNFTARAEFHTEKAMSDGAGQPMAAIAPCLIVSLLALRSIAVITPVPFPVLDAGADLVMPAMPFILLIVSARAGTAAMVARVISPMVVALMIISFD